MLAKLKLVFLPSALAFVVVSFTGAYFSDNVTISGNTFTAGVSSDTDIILNELIPNPVGDDDAAMPGGEWIELYNTGDWSIDVSGWKLVDDDSDEIVISGTNTTAGTIVPSHGYLVVYRNGDTQFNLDNDNDSISLVEGSSTIDNFTYLGVSGNQSRARVPNASSTWIQTTPTKGGANV